MARSTPALSELLTQIEPIARLAGKAILDIYRQPDFELQLKSDKSPLTAADLASDAVIKAGLEKLEDQYPIVSEEGSQGPYSARADAQRIWLVDPLDGTKEFLKRNDEFCVCIALIEAGRPILAVIHAPVTGLSYAATLNGGVQQIDSAGQVFRLSSKPELRFDKTPGLRFGVSRSHLSQATRDYLSHFNSPENVPMGSALKFCAIATGALDAYPRFGPTMEWDTAAGDLLIHEAGGELKHAQTGEKLLYNKPDLTNPFFIAKGWIS